MAKLKMLKLPKKPKANASIEAKKKYLARVQAIKIENKKKLATYNESKRLSKVIAGIGAADVRVFASGFSARVIRPSKSRRKKAAGAAAPKRKKAVKRTTSRKRTATRRKRR